ncbi:uncharacterized protein LOC129596199 [Paramacrobiotus metropolitanus]|uniref:uncharacterized protein LOC129596199 n=1 Tax=Paramacrobiotus metropolitanus TaxID=2943436 RepID=UPI00244567B9|nr:uncharacterized protein LOC129596199 [Paramacrobiotus metropolitanus]
MDSVLENPSLPSLLDFIADPGLIEKYANENRNGPSVPQLIDLFLRQASLENINEPFLRLVRVSRVDVDDRTFLTTRRNRAAKTITLMLASALKWDLATIEKDLSITMQFCLVQDMLNTVFSGTDYCSSIAEPQNAPQRSLAAFTGDVLKYLADHCIFGLALYSRWILRAHIQRKIPKKAAKGGIVSIGAITDPVVLRGLDQQTQGNSLIWSLFRQISREKVAHTSVDLLGEIIKLDRDAFRVPISTSFVIPSSATKTVEPHNWSIGQTISFIEIKMQIIFDLAGYWMFEGKLSQAAEYLQMLNILLKQRSLSSLEFVRISDSVLYNMCKIANVPVDPSVLATPAPTVVELVPSMKSKLLEILLDDLNSGNISASSRSSLELEIQMSEDNTERAVLQKVRLCNLFREYVAGKSVPSFAQLRNILADATPGDAEWMKTVLNSGRLDGELRESITEQLGYLVEHDLLSITIKNKISDFLSDSPRSPSLSPAKGLPEDVEMSSEPPSVKDLHRALLSACTYSAIKSAVVQLINHPSSKIPNLKQLNPSWPDKVPPTLRASCAPTWPASTVELTLAVFAKSTDLAEQGCFRGARLLLKQLRTDLAELSSVPMKFDRNFRWQNTYVDLAESQQMIGTVAMSNDLRFEAVKRAKNCISAALMKPPDEEPVPMYVQSVAVMVLFNLEEWEYITEAIGLQDQKRKPTSSRSVNAIFPFLKQLILACQEYQPQREDLITQSKGGRTKQTTVHRQHCMKLWNNLSAAFSTVDPALAKKPSSSSSSSTLTSEILLPYIRMIRHKSAAYLLFSCIFRMWNVSNRESGSYTIITELLWPTTIPLHLKIQPEQLLSALEGMFSVTEQCAVCDAEIMIIKGDYHYNKGQYELAVKMYLLSAVDGNVPGFLHAPRVPNFSQNTLKKMATCFDSLRYFTYVAIISQLMDPVDYDTAFRAVGEKVTYDASDEAYRFIWDPLILEQLAFLLQKWGFLEKRQIAVDLLQNHAMTAANQPSIIEGLMMKTATEFFEILFDQFVIG